MPDVLADRAALESQIGDQTMVDVLAKVVAERGAEPAFSDRHTADGTGWRTLTWGELHQRARELAAAYVKAGLQPGESVAIMAANRIEHIIADLAAVLAGGVPISIYNTLAPDQVGYVAEHADPRIVVLETDDHVARWALGLKREEISRVVTIDTAVPDDPRAIGWDDFVASGAEALDAVDGVGEELDARSAAVTPDDTVTMLYTSGTTGQPKGVVLTHRNIVFETTSSLSTSGIEEPGILVSYLPFAHIAERVLSLYIPQFNGGHVYLIQDPTLLLSTLQEVHPTSFFGVPRVWEKIRTGVTALLAAETDDAKREAVEKAMAVGLAYVESQQTGQTTSPELQAQFEQADAAVLSTMRALLGLDKVEWAASAAAPMPLEVAKFFAGLGIKVYDVYGMTETTGAATANGPDGFRLGTVGRAHPGIEVRIAEDGEILFRGPITTPGYVRRPEATAALLDDDGWLHTGDIGSLDEDGFLSVVDRKKEMIINSAGKNIAPSNIENLLKESPLVGHAMVVGDGRSYVVAVLTLDGEIAPVVAQKLGVEAGSLAELAQHPVIRGAVGQAVEAANARLSRPEQVKAFELLGEEWTAESEELTPTLKLKRRVVSKKYADIIDGLYAAEQ
ncbi:AMP-dependent synthetase/ligase [Nocardioides sp. NPDC057767]|uniref:AMP-dependent synthetase/ligase n=1 Tax=unclassified Nocardioides TaxID=2615069 RepID=UPI0036715B82